MYETLSVYDNVMVSLQTDRKVFKYMFKRVTPEDNERIWSILEFVELADKANDPVDTLSHGERQWLEMGMLVASRETLTARRADYGDDRRGQAAHRRSDPAASPRTTPCCWWSTTCTLCARSPTR